MKCINMQECDLNVTTLASPHLVSIKLKKKLTFSLFVPQSLAQA